MIRIISDRQRGAVLIMVALLLPVLLGFAGIVIDLGMLFVAKSELQSAMDSCALAAAQELDGASDATTRAANAGLTAANANKVVFQGASVALTAADVMFSDTLGGSYASGFNPPDARYAQCSTQVPGITAAFIRFVGGPNNTSVGALAIATRAASQSVCTLPLGLLPKTGGNAGNNYGYQVGEWVNMVYGTSPAPGEMGWFNMDGSNSATETVKEITEGYCGSVVGQSVGTPGAKASVQPAWNARFGIYKNNTSWPPPIGFEPDQTGYAYTSKNWKNPVPQSAFNGTPAAGSDPTAASFETKRLAFASFADTGTSVNAGEAITGMNLKGGFQILATPGNAGQYWDHGGNRRLATVAVLTQSGGTFTVSDYACMLMLQPMTCNNATNCDPVQLEYLGLASSVNSPCTTTGLPGGGMGPLVPVLVR